MPDHPATPLILPLARLERPAVPDAEKMMTTPIDIWIETLAPYLSPAALAEVRARYSAWLGKSAHPTLISNEFTNFICQAAFPDLPLPEARRRMGRLGVAKYRESVLGRVMLAPLRFIGFERLLRQLPKQFAVATNYGTRWVANLGPRHWRFDCEDELMPPEIVIGNLDAVAEMLGLINLRVIFTLVAPGHYSFDITWGQP